MEKYSPSKQQLKVFLLKKYLTKIKGTQSKKEVSEIIDEKDLQIDRLSIMALNDPSTDGNPKELTEKDMKVMYRHSMSGILF